MNRQVQIDARHLDTAADEFLDWMTDAYSEDEELVRLATAALQATSNLLEYVTTKAGE